jgi:hypothetical protein
MKRSDPSNEDTGSGGDQQGDEAGKIFDDAAGEEDTPQEDTITTTDGDGEPKVFSMAAHDPERWPHVILRGTTADLSALRQKEVHSTFFVGPRELHGTAIPSRIQWQDGASSVGDIFVTESQVLFVSGGTSAEPSAEAETNPQEEDWAIGATCIHLHAMTDEPETSVYLQLHEEGGAEDSTLEVTLIPVDPEGCQVLFDELCRLVSRHPLQVDDDEDGPGFGGGGDFFMGGGDHDDMVWAPSAGFGNVIPDDGDDDDEGDAPDGERAAMLERLDNLLVVRPEFETEEGQFDDADEHHDEQDAQPSPQ